VPDITTAVLGRLFPQLVSYLPLIPLLQRIANNSDPNARAVAILELLRFGAGRTPSSLDDELLALLEPALRTPESQKLVQWLADKLTAGIFAMEQAP
jgi:hypothetical protein